MAAAFFRPLRGPGGCTLGHFFCVLHVCHGFPCGLVPVSVGWLGCFWVVGGNSLSAFDYLEFSMDSTLVWIEV